MNGWNVFWANIFGVIGRIPGPTLALLLVALAILLAILTVIFTSRLAFLRRRQRQMERILETQGSTLERLNDELEKAVRTAAAQYDITRRALAANGKPAASPQSAALMREELASLKSDLFVQETEAATESQPDGKA